ncbi:FAD-dependent monooxygenase [Arthrobacter sp. LjRoot78]
MNTKHVLVLGNGPVGQTTALLLAKRGINVTLLDGRIQRDSIGSKALAQHRDVLDVWEHVGAGAKIAQEGLTWSRSRTYYGSHELFCDTYFESADSPFPPFVNLSQTRTEQLLDEQIAEQPRIKVLWDRTVRGIAQDAAGVTATAVCQDGSEYEFSGDYAVAACGARADELRKEIGVSLDGRTFGDRFLICDIRAELDGWEGERRFYFDPEWNPGRQVLIHPCPDSQYRIDWQVPPGYDLEEDAATGGLDRRIRLIIGDAPYEIVWKSVYRFHSRVVDRMRVGKVLLAGDMAHLVSPFGGRGLNSGIGDAENAAWKLAFVLLGWADESLLDSYDAERRAAAVENIAVTSETMDFLVPQTPEQKETRTRCLEQALTDPGARKNINSGRLFEPFWYSDSALTTPNPERPFAGRPAKGTLADAGPGVILPDAAVTIAGSERRIRRIAREGMMLLLGDRVDAASIQTLARDNCPAPVSILKISDIDPAGSLQFQLKSSTHDVWIIRPDAYIAAVCDAHDPEGIAAALHRAIAATTSLEPQPGLTRSLITSGALPHPV